MKYFRNSLLIIFCFAGIFTLKAQLPAAAGLSAIKEIDLKNDLYTFAGDGFRGREFCSPDELKAAVWLADQMRATGMKPAGIDGTFFQFFNVQRNRVSAASTIKIGDKNLTLWKDILSIETLQSNIDADIVYIGQGTREAISAANLADKVVALIPTYDDLDLNVAFPKVRFMQRLAMLKYRNLLADKKVKGIIFIAADEFTKTGWSEHVHVRFERGIYRLDNGIKTPQYAENMPAFWMQDKDLALLKGNKPHFSANIITESFLYPSVNLIGKIEGADSKLKNEHVLITSHIDHMGVREAQNGDSIYNGADDNGSAVVAMLAIARAYHQKPAKRSQLFISFGAEEPYLFGSTYYTQHPTIKKEDIVAVLNADLIGRNAIDSAAILGTLGENNTSILLTKMALEANNESTKFKLDTVWDNPNHKEGFLYRSDHAPFLKLGIPSVFYTTLLHPDYHTPKDDPEHIDYKKLKKMTEWMYRTSWKVSNSTARPAMNPDFKYRR
ncbi:M28 family peptidase [Pedobacter petrophilus]|uniref:M28 family peptidase n=1 Tax=Pedobacter petrophilus TaxID=1908241 RepID=A0A7K0FWF2_9SPHI|nr:M28 family peptidase [Pedobacter petrophilus]MRX75414.1 M28 family peptidase [Pedobacter petrophilus]